MKQPLSNPFILALKAYNLSVEIHHHAAYQIVMSGDHPFTSAIDGTLYEHLHGFLIKPQVTHFCQAEKGTLSVLNIEPYSQVGRELARRFAPDQDHVVFAEQAELCAFFQGEDPARFDPYALMERLVAPLPDTPYDERVATIVAYIKAHYAQAHLTPQTFAELVFLSPSRLAALFKQQTGSSLSRYLLWTRLRQAIYLTLSDKDQSLTEIAYDTGFYDLPQLNKYMYELFGMPPKALKHNSDLIQVF
ncbi:AraC-type DNA-binding protein [Catalinimonas alkaloidigena]|uniref:AraC-type DNA-binding protein n=1 Tax=Catalinimonas alkaloidigena TaxID=1075417 RepID=A0A1G9TW96_9BACT|nr:AraC family transcriptional regulator [Catalinimonas alkaloidigena]SDM52016.1 AraC-type DNA-binding protein [Catalinimonas alkaloidigena]